MNDRKALANSFYALIASLSLMTGMTMLSVTGPGNQADIETPGDLNASPDIPGNLTPDNTSVEPGDAPGDVSPPDIQEDGLIAEMARSLYGLISGSDVKPSGTTPAGNLSGMNGSKDNMTDNSSINDSQSEINDTAEPNTSLPNQTLPNGTSSPELSDENSSGLLKGLMKQLAEIIDFSGNNTKQSPGNNTPPDMNQTLPDENDTTENRSSEEPEPEENQSSPSSGNETGLSMPDTPPNILPAMALLVIGSLIFLAYRSNIDFIVLFKSAGRRLKDFLLAIPDLFRRFIVRSVVFVSSRLGKLAALAVALVKAPIDTIEKMIERAGKKLNNMVSALRAIREAGVSNILGRMIPGSETPEKGLGLIWYLLRKKAKVSRNTLTPKEIGDRAREQGVDPSTVDEVVRAYRWENYSPDGYQGEMNIENWKEELGDEDR